jgi:hypothetical protein
VCVVFDTQPYKPVDPHRELGQYDKMSALHKIQLSIY